MAQLIILQGLPASGKSTKAKELINKDSEDNTIRVNRDDLRKMLFFMEKDDHDSWTSRRENLVKKVEAEIIKVGLKKHRTVIVDDTNLGKKTVKLWEDIAAEANCKCKVISIDTSVEECIKRDKAREQSVGAMVIRRFNAMKMKLLGQKKQPKKIKKISLPGKKKIVICDIDGTLADVSHRVHYINGNKKNWTKFFDSMVHDTKRENTAQLLDLTYKDHPVVLVTGRPETHREQTEKWLEDNNINYYKLIMRDSNDWRPDYIVKEEILKSYFNIDDIEMVIDDRKSVISMWRRNGLKVINVGGQDNDF